MVMLSSGLDAVCSHLDVMAVNCGPVRPPPLHCHTGCFTRTLRRR